MKANRETSRLAVIAPLALIALVACSSGVETGATTTTGSGGATTTSIAGGSGGTLLIGGDRPVTVEAPPGLAPGERAPLVILLHGYGVGGLVEELYLHLSPIAAARGFFYAHPSGTVDQGGSYFWNATDACCNFYGSDVDDSAYLAGLIDAIVASYPVDPKRVYLVGHSNGGFMSYRMACDHAGKIAAIASLAGAMWQDPSKCQPGEPVHVLQIHGTADGDVDYNGAVSGPGPGVMGYPSAEGSAAAWASIDGCDPAPDTGAAPIDIEAGIDGAETTIRRWAKGCQAGGSAELWSIEGGGHIPEIGDGFRAALVDFLFAHPKP